MQIDRILYPIDALGPGKRIVVWTVGCSKKCNKCSNMELWNFNNNKEIALDKVIDFIKQLFINNKVDGITFTGGDPLEQKDELLLLLKELHELCDDILVYTGYEMDELQKILTIEEVLDLQQYVSVVIDGRYIDELNNSDCVLRGSANQHIRFFNTDIEYKYEEYMKKGRLIQNIYIHDKVISVGIHDKECDNYEYKVGR